MLTDMVTVRRVLYHCCCGADEDHFNTNVQLRRTARYDSGVATVLQKEENQIYQEKMRQKQLK